MNKNLSMISDTSLSTSAELTGTPISSQAPQLLSLRRNNGHYLYLRPADMLLAESCNHFIKIFFAANDSVKEVLHYISLKNFLNKLPSEKFIRVGRFYVVNIERLTGGNCFHQTFEFNFRLNVKVSHLISSSAFANLGS